ncbi:di-trans,poly-cis-decaprenylcistransferase Nus1 [Schizosaccharomyces osmophilus]|uniref:ditrans,polycis-polyprenyl diphosphate synthase [(2E,6E)-farnesyldiphosphate specific] n=1 Tax=Schizosaccharomyces osmophilus TaxID=2545709 RepID=A0AAE9W7Z6_9SCHI|nr:di-trans,poly-cis-decaprenylcistransferase Nus1 [Schizosaccharomyces osmophilus]WBW71113.1 di-trans,poly-cis-decaprenylcistransferase Nus1 [Schizosaccharomyces osmophilus]
MFRRILYFLVYWLIHKAFSVYASSQNWISWGSNYLLNFLYHHHCSRDLIRRDTIKLNKKPRHLSVLLECHDNTGLEGLIHDTCELAAWCICSAIPELTIYERKGFLKRYPEAMEKAIYSHLPFYVGREKCVVQVRNSCSNNEKEQEVPKDLKVHLIAEEDGRDAIIDLTRGLADLATKKVITSEQVTQELIDKELTESVIPEPDLLIIFSPYLKLRGFPPWQLRLCEIFHDPVFTSPSYLSFYKALTRYSTAEMRLGH